MKNKEQQKVKLGGKGSIHKHIKLIRNENNKKYFKILLKKN